MDDEAVSRQDLILGAIAGITRYLSDKSDDFKAGYFDGLKVACLSMNKSNPQYDAWQQIKTICDILSV